MTTYNFTDGSITGQDAVPDNLPNTACPFTRSNIVDWANQNATVTSVSQVLQVPADTWVTQIFCRCITADANASFKLGSGLDDDQWSTEVTAIAGNKAMLNAAEYFAAADTIDAVALTTLDTAKFEFVAEMIPGNKADADGSSQHST